MRLWHYKLIPYLPNKQLVSQWRECVAIKRQWEKGTLIHPLVSYVMKYDKSYFYSYFLDVALEMEKRNIKHNNKFITEMNTFCNDEYTLEHYPEHDNRYLTQCYYNLQEKYDRGIITRQEWLLIEEYITTDLETKRNKLLNWLDKEIEMHKYHHKAEILEEVKNKVYEIEGEIDE